MRLAGSRPGVVLVTGPGAASSAGLPWPGDGGVSLLDVVSARAVAEAGEVVAVVADDPAGRALLADLLATADRPLAVVDAATLALATTYGDAVAAPDPVDLVLDAPWGPMAVRLAPASAAHAAAALRGTPGAGLLADLAGLAAAGDGRRVATGDLPVARVTCAADLADAVRVVESADEAALRLRRASRADDGFLSTFLVRPLSRRLTGRAVAAGLSPNPITLVSLSLGLAAAAAYAGGGLGWLVAGSLLLLVSLVVDCVDGEVARHTRRTSPLGGWLDVGSDRVKEYAAYAGLAAGSAAAGVWGVALGALGVLLVRHLVDFGFAASRTAPPGTAAGGAVDALSRRTSERAWLMWAKRAVILPVGERTILLAVLVPLAGARTALLVLLVLGLVGGAYSTAGRVARAVLDRATGGTATSRRRVAAIADAGPLPERALPVGGRLGWLLPATLRAVEVVVVVLALRAAVGPAADPAAYGWLAVVSFRSYDLVYRQRLTGTVDPRGPLGVVGAPVRCLVVLLLALVAGSAAGAAVGVAAAVLGAAALGDSLRWWAASVRSRP